MTAQELVRAALRHEETERIPYNFMFTPPAQATLESYYSATDLQSYLNPNLYLYGCADKPLYASPAEYGPTITDQFGVVWSTSDRDRGSPVGPPLADLSLCGYELPDPREPGRWEAVPEAAQKHPDQFRVAVVGDLWERACFMCGLSNLLLALYTKPSFVHDLLDHLCEYNLVTLEGMTRFKYDGMIVSDDYGLQDSLVMSPASWRTFVRPRLARICDAVHRHGSVMMLHSCGNVTEIIPDLIEIGLDILHPMQPEAMDVFALKREFGRDITFCGGISTQLCILNLLNQ